MQVQPLVESPGQVCVLTVTTSDGAAQLQFRGMLLAPPLTVIVALAGQSISGMVTVVVVDWPGEREPLAGLMVMPLTPLSLTVHTQATWLFALAAREIGQLQPSPAL